MEHLQRGYAQIRAILDGVAKDLEPIELANCLAFIAIETIGDAYGKDQLRAWYEDFEELLEAYYENVAH